MPSEENYLYIPGYSKCILKILTAEWFWVHSKYAGPFLWPARIFCSCSKLSRCIRSGEISNGIRSILTAHWLHSKYSYGIPTAFRNILIVFEGKSKRQSTSNPARMSRMRLELSGMHLDCCRDLFRHQNNSAGMRFELMPSESFEVHSEYSSCILFEFLDVRTIFGCHSESVLTAF